MKTIRTLLIATVLLAGGSVSAKNLTIDTHKTEITWVGKKVGGQHSGTINLKNADLKTDAGAIISGVFVIDMNSITDSDLSDAGMKQKLEGHLKSDDFFGVSKYPEAKLIITKKAPFKGNVAHVNADLTIKGITHPVEFDVTRDGKVYSANITVNRAKYNVRYGSGSFFDNLGDKVIYDDFEIGVKLITK